VRKAPARATEVPTVAKKSVPGKAAPGKKATVKRAAKR
jgi:hypothetical protein